MALVTSNLPVSSILSLLGVSGARDIFYVSGALKTKAQLEALVNKEGLNPAYCPGTTNDDRITNLLNDRSLKYFKGYDHTASAPPAANIAVSPLVGSILASQGTYNITTLNASSAWSVISKPAWVISVNPASGTNGGSNIYVDVPNNIDAERSGDIIFKLNDYSNQVIFTLTQQENINT